MTSSSLSGAGRLLLVPPGAAWSSRSRRPESQPPYLQPQPAGGGSPGSAADAVADVGGLRRVDHPDDLQLDVRRQDVEQPEPLTEQRRDLVNLQLVQHTGLQRP